MEFRIREIRKKCGLTMKELGERVGVSESAISQYETGKRQPDYETLLKIADYFNVSVDYLLGQETEKAPEPEEQKPLSREQIKFALFGEDAPSIPEEKLDEVLRYAEIIKHM